MRERKVCRERRQVLRIRNVKPCSQHGRDIPPSFYAWNKTTSRVLCPTEWYQFVERVTIRYIGVWWPDILRSGHVRPVGTAISKTNIYNEQKQITELEFECHKNYDTTEDRNLCIYIPALYIKPVYVFSEAVGYRSIPCHWRFQDMLNLINLRDAYWLPVILNHECNILAVITFLMLSFND